MKFIKKIKPTLWLAVGLLWLVGCDSEADNTGSADGDADADSDGDADGDADGDSDSDVDVCDEGDLSGVCASGGGASIVLTDAYNYSFWSDLTVGVDVVKGAASLVDLTFDWSALTTSFLEESVSPTSDIDMVVVSLWSLTQDELRTKINNDDLLGSDRMGAVCAETGGAVSSENLLDFNICLGEPVADNIAEVSNYFNAEASNYDPSLYTHMLMVKSGTNLDGNLNVKMLKFFTLDANATNTTVSIDDNSASLAFDANLRSQSRIPAAVGNPSIVLDWSYVETNGLGNDFVSPQITRMVVAHYPMNVCQLEDDFLHLETDYDAWYSISYPNAVTSQNLSELKDASGASFPGVTGDGTWIVALFCGSCSNPAPWFMTILQPC